MDGSDLEAKAFAAGESVAGRLVAEGAQGVLLAGSFARGDATTFSDLDLVALGDGPEYRLERVEPFLVSVSWRTPEAVRGEFHDPALVSTVVPGFRSAAILADPGGAAAALQAEAQAWTWDSIAAEADAWVRGEVTGYAEEVLKLARDPVDSEVAVLRSLLGFRMARIALVHRRRLWVSERYLWDLAAEEMGDHWRNAQDLAIGLLPATVDEGRRAALTLYVLVAREVYELLDERERTVVEYACALAHRIIER